MAPTEDAFAEDTAAARRDEDRAVARGDVRNEGGSEQDQEEKRKLTLDVQVEKVSACKRHIKVQISREDIERYLHEAFAELTPRAEVRGFRPGRAPRKLVEQQFREQIRDQVKGSLLLDSLQQISESHDLSAISEPDFDVLAVELPEDGPFTFEFDLEVRPEFDMPNWRGLRITRPVHEITPEEVQRHVQTVLSSFSRLVPVDGPAEPTDHVVVAIEFRRNGEVLSSLPDQTIRIRPTVSFRDGTLEGFDTLVVGARAGDRRTAACRLGEHIAREDLSGQEVTADVEILEVKRMELPPLSAAFLNQIGGFVDEEAFQVAVRRDLERRFQYHQSRAIREQITKYLTAAANWELPDDLLKRQARREMDRAVMELQSSGFSLEEIEAHQNQLRQNVYRSTETALREHFILERIAEEIEIYVSDEDYNLEIALLAMTRNESPRRVRARLEKRGQMDTLRNQIIERKVIESVKAQATFEDVSFTWPESNVSAVSHTICGADEETEIPEAQGVEAEELRQPVDRG